MFKIKNNTKKKIKRKVNHPNYIKSLIIINSLAIFCIVGFNLTYDIGPALLFRDNLRDAFNDFVTDNKLLGIPVLLFINVCSISSEIYDLLKKYKK
ncbi:hypothetical protein WR164_13250 [Philodulcilactobacillus myokoensis]|uniref:Uncharacterized protein n=1 Tax=Philodulcilactobacillus myokoensis TaxID=2929573 RepID=A0A9W6ESS4_9LACO|nr:hypothetical protein [Philodulcilactobacillus myokoensis]GLB47346.1 hypothetical protein WR164_13250 [Philodulcilactobacillus myokoensis]